MTYAIAACARNEGPFLIEWIAHHLSIGFDKIFIATNHYEDGTDDILDRLSSEWPIYRIENTEPLEGLTFQRSAVRRCLSHEAITDQEWVLHIDLDEFLNIQSGDDIASFMSCYEDSHAVMLGWRLFGNDDRSFWDGGGVLDGFARCQADMDNFAQKSLFRRAVFQDAAPHCPKEPTLSPGELKIVNTEHVLLDPSVCYRRRGTVLLLEPEHKTWAGAAINHYMHKSRDLTRLSRHLRGDANGRRARRRRTPDTEEYIQFNRNDVVDGSIHVNRLARIRTINALPETPGVLEAHYRAHNWFFEKLIGLYEPSA